MECKAVYVKVSPFESTENPATVFNEMFLYFNNDYSGTVIAEKTFIAMALSFPGTEQVPHFDRIGFKVTGRRMFATYLAKDKTANVFLTPHEQRAFCKMDKNIYPVPNKWGEKGATTFDLKVVSEELVMEALQSAYEDVIKKK